MLIRRINISLSGLPWAALLLLGGCAAFTPPPAPPDPRLDEVLAGLQRCASLQEQASVQLSEQTERLVQQQTQLEALSGVLDVDVSETEPAPTIVAETPTAIVACEQGDEPPTMLLVGELEQVWLNDLDIAVAGRVDTGAETASLDARNIEIFERDGRRWVRFEILHPQGGEPFSIERKLKRMVLITQSNSAEPERRPVVLMGITIGHISQTAEFTLSNRSHLDYQVLIGRNILKDFMLVDVSKKNIAPYVVEPADDVAESP
tara:strand:- start:108213 stop:108998 length:786 start_codon:yes stop_codon:yes gene_type:complete